MEKIQFIETSPQKLKEEIGEEIKSQLKSFLEHFSPKIPEQYLTKKEVAQLLKVNVSTIHYWGKNGILPPYGMGSRVYYLRSDIEAKLKPLK